MNRLEVVLLLFCIGIGLLIAAIATPEKYRGAMLVGLFLALNLGAVWHICRAK